MAVSSRLLAWTASLFSSSSSFWATATVWKDRVSVVEDKFRVFSRLWINRVDLIECMLNFDKVICEINYFY